MVEHFRANFPACWQPLEMAFAIGIVFRQAVSRIHAQLIALHDPGVTFGIIQEIRGRALVIADFALAGDRKGLIGLLAGLGLLEVDALEVQLGDPGYRHPAEDLILPYRDLDPVEHPQLRTVDRRAERMKAFFQFVDIEFFDPGLRCGVLAELRVERGRGRRIVDACLQVAR